jgi:phosphoribosylaminoimidazolecarboxamide formyltransferase/IMP cyclohydrolase
MNTLATIRRAVLSVTDKSGLIDLAGALVEHDVQLFASGGTATHLQQAGIDVTPVEELTRFPEILDGRVKTLHPGLLAGVLADPSRRSHRDDLDRHGIPPLDLVVVNFYAFEAAAKDEALPIEAIDIGGPTLVRAAAKNHSAVTVLTDPSDYDEFVQAFQRGRLDDDFRRRMASRAFQRVAHYDRAIAERFEAATQSGPGNGNSRGAAALASRRRPAGALRYGENPHQSAEAWIDDPAWGLGAHRQVAGEALSYNNLLDADAALDLLFDLGDEPACAIIKHNNACGAARAASLCSAYEAALACDPTSAFGGVVAVNGSVDLETARALGGHFLEVLCAERVAPEALELLKKKKRLRILEVSRSTWEPPTAARLERTLHGMALVQDRDRGFAELEQLRVVTQRQPSDAELRDAAFLLAVAKHVRSNAIVIGRGGRTLGIGAGQMSRVDSCDIAVHKAQAAGHELRGSIAASDAFFPFADGVERLAAAGVQVVLQPGGSKRDPDVVAAADDLGICMLFSGRRHFRH